MVENNLPVDSAEVVLLTEDHSSLDIARAISAFDVARHLRQTYTEYDEIKMAYEVHLTNVVRVSGSYRGVKIKSRLFECDFPNDSLTDEERYGIWSGQFAKIVNSLMVYLDNESAVIYYHGRYDRVIPVNSKSISKDVEPTC